MPDPFFMEKKLFPKEKNPDGRNSYVVGQRPVNVCIREFTTSDEPYYGTKGNFGYFGFTPQIEEWVKTHTAGHLAIGNCRGIKELYGNSKGKTAIICGSGRSILKAKEFIPDKGTPEHEDLVVFALNGAGEALGADKVDYLFALDYSARAKDMPHIGVKSWYPPELHDLPIIMSFNCPEILGDIFKTRHYFAFLLKEDEKRREEYGFLECGNIASYSCAHMAFKMGVKRVIWVGHDYCYLPEDGKLWNHWNEPMTMAWQEAHHVGYALDMNGYPVPCDERLIHNMRITAAISYMMGDQGIEVINATGCGTLGIKQEPEKDGAAGVYTMPLDEALSRCRKEILECQPIQLVA